MRMGFESPFRHRGKTLNVCCSENPSYTAVPTPSRLCRMRTPERLKSGRYKVRFRRAGTQSSETFETLREARRFAQLLDALGPQGALDQLYTESQQAHVPSMDEIAADHIEHLTGVEYGTRLTYERMWARGWSPMFGATPANRLTRDDVSRALNILAERYSGKTIRNYHSLLSAVCKRAVEQRYLTSNPARGVRLPRSREAEAVEMRILNPDEFDLVLSRIPEHYQPLVRFLAGTGARWGEAVTLTVADVDPPNVRIRRALKWSPDNRRSIGATKTRRGNRVVALPTSLLADMALLTADRPGDAHLFTEPGGEPVEHRRFWANVWIPAVSDLRPRPRIHDLRHTHASWLLARGVPIHVVQARLGHEKIATTVDTYGHLLPDAQVAAAAAAEAAMGPSHRPPELTNP